MADSFTEVTEQSWFSRIGGAIKGVLIGLLLFVVAFPLLFWNEGQAVRTYKTLKEGAKSVIDVSADKLDVANEGKLVHASGKLVTTSAMQDDEFGVSAAGVLQLKRQVEMYQWKESSESKTDKNLGGSTTTAKTYQYSKEWSANHIESTKFKVTEGHVNPAATPYGSQSWLAGSVTLGAFQMPASLVGQIRETTSLTPGAKVPLPALLGSKAQRTTDGFYVGSDPATPQVGDVRIRFAVINPSVVSVIARQQGGGFTPYVTRGTGQTIEMLQLGEVPASLMFQHAVSQSQTLTWILRVVGFVVMLIGVNLVLRPLAVLGDVLPLLGDVLEFGIGLIAFVVAAPLSLLTIAIAWLVYRPLLGIALIALAAGIVYLVRMQILKKKTAAAGVPVPA